MKAPHILTSQALATSGVGLNLKNFCVFRALIHRTVDPAPKETSLKGSILKHAIQARKILRIVIISDVTV